MVNVGDRGMYNDLGKEVDEFIFEPDAFVEVGESTLSDKLCSFGCYYRVNHYTTHTA